MEEIRFFLTEKDFWYYQLYSISRRRSFFLLPLLLILVIGSTLLLDGLSFSAAILPFPALSASFDTCFFLAITTESLESRPGSQ